MIIAKLLALNEVPELTWAGKVDPGDMFVGTFATPVSLAVEQLEPVQEPELT